MKKELFIDIETVPEGELDEFELYKDAPKNLKDPEKIKKWEEQDLIIYFIPPYSPELNLIEIFWRFVKYQWLSFDAFANFESLKKHLKEVLDNFGLKYMINFN